MTEKAQQIMAKIREKDGRRLPARLRDPQRRSIMMERVNRMDQDDTSRVGSTDQEIRVLKEMNELQDFENENWSR
jgi:hypothetical protein